MRIRIHLLVLAVVPLVVGLPAAHADDRVPRVYSKDLPSAGTCAPLRKVDVTHVLVGRKKEFGWYRIASQRERVLNDEQLRQVLAERAAASKRGDRSEHSVWITAAKDHRWAHVVKVSLLCAGAGIYRVGLRVRSEATQRVYGFPLFLPPHADPNAPSTGKAKEMSVRVRTFAKEGDVARPTIQGANPIERDALQPSNLDNVFVAATRAVKKHGKVVASVRMATNATVQDAVRVLDLLYRGGCAAVRLRMTTNIASPKVDVYPVVTVGPIALGDKAPLRPPPVQPRSEPWPLDGANATGWVGLELEPMPESESGPRSAQLPNFAARGAVPAFEFEKADATVRNWAQGLSADLVAAARGGPQLVSHLVQAARSPEALPAATQPLRTFSDASSLDVSTFLVSAYLYNGPQGVGRVDMLVHVATTRLQVVYARWNPTAPSGSPGPMEVDPFAGGTAGRLRVWVEAMCLSARTSGAAALPLADPRDVLAAFPTVAHPNMSRTMSQRDGELVQLVEGLRGTRFDRVLLRPGQMTAGAVHQRAVVGVLYAHVVAEDGELRLRNLNAQRVR